MHLQKVNWDFKLLQSHVREHCRKRRGQLKNIAVKIEFTNDNICCKEPYSQVWSQPLDSSYRPPYHLIIDDYNYPTG